MSRITAAGPGTTIRSSATSLVAEFLSLPAKFTDLERCVNALQKGQESQLDELTRIAAAVNHLVEGQIALNQRQEILEHATKVQEIVTERHYQTHVIDPVARRLIPLTELARCAGTYRFGREDLVRLVSGLHEQMIELLEEFGCRRFESEEGAAFDPKFMKPKKAVEAPNKEMCGKVAGSLQPGYRAEERVLRFETIVIYSEQHNQNQERSEDT